MQVEIKIQNGDKIYTPLVEEGASLTWEAAGSPGKLTFTMVKDGVIDIQEGNPTQLLVDGAPIFLGYIFTKKRNKAGTIEITAYDQLRYMKNKYTFCGAGLTASALLRQLAGDFRLNLGTIEDTGYVLSVIDEENQTLLDMMEDALAETKAATGKRFILYDDCGNLNLRDSTGMRLDLLVDHEKAEDFSYESSIDKDTYNKVLLLYEDKKTGQRKSFIARDGEKLDWWGVLQYYKTIREEAEGATAQSLLAQYAKKNRTLSIDGAFGDCRVRGGSQVEIVLDLGDMMQRGYMTVEQVTHRFRSSGHFMDLTLTGGEFIA